MATPHTSAQGLQRSKLQLLDSSFGLFQSISDFANGALFNETLLDDASLNRRKLVDQSKKASVVVDGFPVVGGKVCRGGDLWRVVSGGLLARGPLVMISERVGGDADEPGSEGSAAPFIRGKICEGFVKDF